MSIETLYHDSQCFQLLTRVLLVLLLSWKISLLGVIYFFYPSFSFSTNERLFTSYTLMYLSFWTGHKLHSSRPCCLLIIGVSLLLVIFLFNFGLLLQMFKSINSWHKLEASRLYLLLNYWRKGTSQTTYQCGSFLVVISGYIFSLDYFFHKIKWKFWLNK